jgi:large subunit ribosomal protein L23
LPPLPALEAMAARGIKQFFPNVVIRLVKPVVDAPTDTVKFKVPIDMTKIQLKHWLTQLYGVSVVKVNTQVRAGRVSRSKAGTEATPRQKIAHVRLDKPWALGRDI